MFNRVGNAPRGQPVRNVRGRARRLNGRSQRPGAEQVSSDSIFVAANVKLQGASPWHPGDSIRLNLT